MASFAWSIDTVLLVLVVGCFHKLAVILLRIHNYARNIVVGDLFLSLVLLLQLALFKQSLLVLMVVPGPFHMVLVFSCKARIWIWIW